MKQTMIITGGTGKLAGAVYSQRYGETIIREYKPTIANPNTKAQVDQRAKFKLLSQLAAVLAPALYFQRNKGVSPRNLFVKNGQPLVSINDNEASIDMLSLQLGRGVLARLTTPVLAERTATVSGATLADVDEVVFVCVTMTQGAPTILREVISVEPTGTGLSRTATASFTNVGGFGNTEIVYAYGIRFNDAGAKARYENEVGKLSTGWVSALAFVRTAKESDVSFTSTVAVRGTAEG